MCFFSHWSAKNITGTEQYPTLFLKLSIYSHFMDCYTSLKAHSKANTHWGYTAWQFKYFSFRKQVPVQSRKQIIPCDAKKSYIPLQICVKGQSSVLWLLLESTQWPCTGHGARKMHEELPTSSTSDGTGHFLQLPVQWCAWVLCGLKGLVLIFTNTNGMNKLATTDCFKRQGKGLSLTARWNFPSMP